jgi:hypothetical protein
MEAARIYAKDGHMRALHAAAAMLMGSWALGALAQPMEKPAIPAVTSFTRFAETRFICGS